MPYAHRHACAHVLAYMLQFGNSQQPACTVWAGRNCTKCCVWAPLHPDLHSHHADESIKRKHPRHRDVRDCLWHEVGMLTTNQHATSVTPHIFQTKGSVPRITLNTTHNVMRALRHCITCPAARNAHSSYCLCASRSAQRDSCCTGLMQHAASHKPHNARHAQQPTIIARTGNEWGIWKVDEKALEITERSPVSSLSMWADATTQRPSAP